MLAPVTSGVGDDIRTIADYNPSFGGPENTPWLDVHRRNCILLVTIISSLSYKFNI
jgi:hypothetical protein